MRLSALPLIAGLALTAAVSACGDDEPKGPTKAEWTAAADKICAEAQAKLTALGPPPLGDPAKLPDWARDGIAVRAEQMARLKSTGKPVDQKVAIDATLAKAETLLDTARSTLENAKGTLPLTQLGELQRQQVAIQQELAAQGPSKCGPE